MSTGVEERIAEGIGVSNSRGFLTLSLQTTSRAGHYICKTLEVREDTHRAGYVTHSIIMSIHIARTTHTHTRPIDTTLITTEPTTSDVIIEQTTQSTTTTTVSTELFYTPDYDNLFVGLMTSS